jgi:putative addiction module CopG family antidote
MTVHVNEDDAGFVRESIATGSYSSAEEVVHDAICLLQEQHRARASALERERREIVNAIAEADRGEMITFDEAFAAHIEAAASRRFAILRSR